MSSPFSDILRRVVETVPGAIGAVFADWEGEPVDQFSHAEAYDIQVLGAHWGIVLAQITRSLKKLAYGGVREIWIEGAQTTFVLYTVTEAYFVLLAAQSGTNLGGARRELERALVLLRSEM